jgi:hypothetical protein
MTALALLAAVACASAPGPKVTFGKPFALTAGRPVTLGGLSVRMTDEHVPIQRGPNGIELFPITTYSLEWHEGKDSQVMNQLRPSSGLTRVAQASLFGRYTFTMQRGSNEDEVTVTVFKRTCLLSYTSSNQLKHEDGAIIALENEDLCCYYSDGPNRCDPSVTRAQAPAQVDEKYCVLYSSQPLSAHPDETCCCRYEAGEPLDPECQAGCARLGISGSAGRPPRRPGTE